MDKVVAIGKNYALVYRNCRLRKMDNEEIYEANIRSDFTRKMIPTFDSCEIVKIA